MNKRKIRIRDPFILKSNDGIYYMYGTTALIDDSLFCTDTFSVYTSKDLENFDGPYVVFSGKENGFWADKDYWAPEVYLYKDKYYMFASFKSDNHERASQILVANNPKGPFKPLTKEPITPKGWECLDCTLWIENGVPYAVFSHEWVQIYDGEICAVRLSDDLTKRVGEVKTLFKASSYEKVNSIKEENGNKCYVTDGPFLYKEGKKLKMIWSSIADGKYSVLEAESDSVLGPWKQLGSKFDFDGGHAMIFTDFNGTRKISLHAPNSPNLERAVFFDF